MWPNAQANSSAAESKALARARAKELSESIRSKNLKMKSSPNSNISSSSNGKATTSAANLSKIPTPSATTPPMPTSRYGINSSISTDRPSSVLRSRLSSTSTNSSIPPPSTVTDRPSSVLRSRLSSTTSNGMITGRKPLYDSPTAATATTASRLSEQPNNARSTSTLRRQSAPPPTAPSSSVRPTATTATTAAATAASTQSKLKSASPGQLSPSTSTATGISKLSSSGSRLPISQRAISAGGTRSNINHRIINNSVKAGPADESNSYQGPSNYDDSLLELSAGLSDKLGNPATVQAQDKVMKFPIGELLETSNHYTIEPRQSAAALVPVPKQKKSDLDFLNQSILLVDNDSDGLLPEADEPTHSSALSSDELIQDKIGINNNKNSSNNNNNNFYNRDDINNNRANILDHQFANQPAPIPSYPPQNNASTSGNMYPSFANSTPYIANNKDSLHSNANNPPSNNTVINHNSHAHVALSSQPQTIQPTIIQPAKIQQASSQHKHQFDVGTMTDDTLPTPTMTNHHINSSPILRDSSPINRGSPSITYLIQSLKNTCLVPAPAENSDLINSNIPVHSTSSQTTRQQLVSAQQLLEAILSPAVHFSSPLDSTLVASNLSAVTKSLDNLPLHKPPPAITNKDLIRSNISPERVVDGDITPKTDISAISQATSVLMQSAYSADTRILLQPPPTAHYHDDINDEVGHAELPKSGVVAARLRAIRERINMHNFHTSS